MTTKQSTIIETAIQIALIAILGIWCFKIAQPFISPIIWAGIIAIGTYPIFLWFKNKTQLSAGWSATMITLSLLFVLITPTLFISGALIENAQTLTHYIENEDLEIPLPPKSLKDWPLVGEPLDQLWTTASEDPQATFSHYHSEIKAFAKWILSTAAGASLNILIFIFSIIIAGIFMVSGAGVKRTFVAIFDRVANDRGIELTELSLSTVKSVVTGILGIALIQCLLSGIGFIVMDIPAAGILAFICLILAIVQIDILLLLIPISIYVFSDPNTGTGMAIAFLIWNIGVGLLNNVLKPILLSKGVNAPMAVIFVGAIGGLMLSGIVGLFIGAVIMVLGYNLFMVWLKLETISPVSIKNKE